MSSTLLTRAGIRSAARMQQRRGVATLATFKTPGVFNEPNVRATEDGISEE